MESRPIKVFLSHSSKNRSIVEWIVSHAKALGIEVYLAEHDHQPGKPLAVKIIKAIEGSDAFIALITTDGGASSYVQQEVGVAIARGKPIIPIVERGVQQEVLAMLDGIEQIKFESSALPEACGSLTESLHVLIQSQAEPKGNEVDLRLVLAVAAVALLLIMMYSSTS